VFNLSACSSGSVVRHCTFRTNRRYGIFMKASHALIEDNDFFGMTSSAIAVENDPPWPEGPVPQQVTIRRNRIERVDWGHYYARDPHAGAIQVRGLALKGIAQGRVIRGVTIEDNELRNISNSAIMLGAVEEARVTRNRVSATGGALLRYLRPVVNLQNCSRVMLSDLSINDPRTSTTQAVALDAKCDAASIKMESIDSKLAAQKP
jgi:hypothetical protein